MKNETEKFVPESLVHPVVVAGMAGGILGTTALAVAVLASPLSAWVAGPLALALILAGLAATIPGIQWMRTQPATR